MLKQQVKKYLLTNVPLNQEINDGKLEIEFRFRKTPKDSLKLTSLLSIFTEKYFQQIDEKIEENTMVYNYEIYEEKPEPAKQIEEKSWADMTEDDNVFVMECEEEEYNPDEKEDYSSIAMDIVVNENERNEGNDIMKIRKIVSNDSGTSFEQKTLLKNNDFADNLRCSLALEKILPNEHANELVKGVMPQFMRDKHRISYVFKEIALRLDITEVIQKRMNERESTKRFEIEIELLQPEWIQNTDTGIKYVEKICNIVVSVYRLLSITVTYCKNINEYANFSGVKPKSIEVKDLSRILNGSYTVTEKAEGLRKLMLYFRNGDALPGYVFLMGTNHMLKESHLRFEINLRETVLDAEEITIDGSKHYFVFDILWFNGKDLRYGNNLAERLSYFTKVLEYMHIDEKKYIHLKKFIDISQRNTRETLGGDILELRHLQNNNTGKCVELEKKLRVERIMKKWKSIYPYKIDGLIFTPTNLDYGDFHMKNQMFKWKPPHENTIDFTIKWRNHNHWLLDFERKKNRTNIGWQCYENEKKLCETKLSKESQKKFNQVRDGSVVEMRYDADLQCFQPLRVREDKITANFEKVVYDTWRSILNPVELAMFSMDKLTAKKQYDKLSTLKPLKPRQNMENYEIKMFHNFVKRSIISIYGRCSKNVLDLAAGRGGDMGKFLLLKHIKKLHLVDNSTGLLTNAKEREETHMRTRTEKLSMNDVDGRKRKIPKVNVNYSAYDLRNEIILSDTYDLVSCQFALHYFFESDNTVQNFFGTVSRHLRPGGFFIGTCFDGRSVYNYVNNTSVAKQRSLKNHIVPFFSTSTRSAQVKQEYGMKIAVHMQDSMVHSDEGVPEYLVFFDVLARVAEQYDLRLVESMSFKNYYATYKEHTERKYWLCEEDQQFSFLNRLFVFQKCKNVNHVEMDTNMKMEMEINKNITLPYFFNKKFQGYAVKFCLSKDENADYFTRMAYMFKYVTSPVFRDYTRMKQVEKIRSEIKAVKCIIEQSITVKKDGYKEDVSEISDEEIIQYLLDKIGNINTGFVRIIQNNTGKSKRYTYWSAKPIACSQGKCENYIVLYIADEKMYYITYKQPKTLEDEEIIYDIIPSDILTKALGKRGHLNL